MEQAERPLQWDDLSVPGVLRAADDIGIYVIASEPSETYRVGYFPSPGPEVEWASGLPTLDDAKRESPQSRSLQETGVALTASRPMNPPHAW